MTHQLTTPASEEQIRALRVGDAVEISGALFTGRDAAHKYFHQGGALPPGVSFEGMILYHCGPVVIRDERGEWKAVAAGPTTSIREEPYEAEIIRRFGLRGVIGKGGMGPKTLEACQKNTAASTSTQSAARPRSSPNASARSATSISWKSSARPRRSGNSRWNGFPPW